MLLVFCLDLSLDELGQFAAISLPLGGADFPGYDDQLDAVLVVGHDEEVREPEPCCSK